MSNAARKAAKRAGLQFHHPIRQVTPVPERIENRPKWGQTAKGKPTVKLTAAARKRINDYTDRRLEDAPVIEDK